MAGCLASSVAVMVVIVVIVLYRLQRYGCCRTDYGRRKYLHNYTSQKSNSDESLKKDPSKTSLRESLSQIQAGQAGRANRRYLSHESVR